MSVGLLIIIFAFIFCTAIIWHFVTLNYVSPKVALEDRLEYAIYLKSSINGELCLFTDIRVSNIVIEQTLKYVRLDNGREFSLSRDEHLDSDLWDILYHINCSLSGDRDHPRMHGEHLQRVETQAAHEGSSPYARGAPENRA